MRFNRIILVLALLIGAGCEALSPAPTATPTATPTLTVTPSATPTSTATFTPSSLPATATPTDTPTITPTATNTPSPTVSPTPSNTPGPSIGFVYDNTEFLDISDDLFASLGSPLIAFVSQNDRQTPALGTPLPQNNQQTLYYTSPRGGGRINVLEMNGATDTDIVVAPSGNAIAFFRNGSTVANTGLYIVDLEIGIQGRILPMNSLVQRGLQNPPVWSPDGTQLAVAVATAYDIDIFTINKDGTNPRNLTRHGSYDFWPSWSPDGRSLIFVSDRNICPSWIPGEPQTCDGTDAFPPIGGHVFLLNIATGQIQQISEQIVTEPPRWINNRQIVYSSGDPLLLGDTEVSLYMFDLTSGSEREIRSSSGFDDALKLVAAWSPNGDTVLYQAAGGSTEIVMLREDGTPLGRMSDFVFTRYGMKAAWSPDGERVAIGGTRGQCPTGSLVLSNTFQIIAAGNPPPALCDPVWSPDSSFIAYMGVTPRATGSVDGRVDVFVANRNGQVAGNLTSNLRGTVQLLGWVGG